MKNTKKYVSLLVVILFAFLCVSCQDDVESFSSKITKSMKSVKTIESVQTIKDNEVTVYSYKKTVTFDGSSNAEVVEVTSTLGGNFTLVDQTKEEVIENVDRNTLFNLSLDESLFESVTIEDDKMTLEVTKDNIQQVMKNENIKILDKATIVFTFENNKVKSMTCTFKTETSKDAVISTSYGY